MSRIADQPKRVDIDPVRGYAIRYNRHPQRKNNFKVAEMYDAYKDGMSLATIAKLYAPLTRQAVYDTFRSRGYPLRTKKFKGLQMLDGIRFTLTKGGHLRGTQSNGRRVLMHWYVWEKAHGPIPPGHCIFHKDRNPANNALENLELLPKAQMSYVFNPGGRNQFSKKEK
jgi:hypothetical protein